MISQCIASELHEQFIFTLVQFAGIGSAAIFFLYDPQVKLASKDDNEGNLRGLS